MVKVQIDGALREVPVWGYRPPGSERAFAGSPMFFGEFLVWWGRWIWVEASRCEPQLTLYEQDLQPDSKEA